MGRKHVIRLELFTASSMAVQQVSKVIEVGELDKASIHAYWVAGPAGTFEIQARNMNDKSDKVDQWYTLDTGTPWAVTAADDSVHLVLNEMPFTEIRLIYTPTSGSGMINAYLTSKTIGA